MAMFDYKHYDSAQSAELMQTSQQLATFTNISPKLISETFNFVGKISGDYFAHTIQAQPPEGWRDLTPSELKLPDNSVDFLGYYTIKSPLTGQANLGMGPQAKIFGEFNELGVLTRISLSFSGTNDLLDVADYFQIQSGEIVPNFEPLLNAIKNLAQENGLTAKDIIVTGYSLGGAFTNMLAEYRHAVVDGFFADANYIGHDSPYVYDDAQVVLNMGYENDVVYRILGNESNIQASIAAGKPGLVNPDKMFEGTFDNIVLFNDTYASPLWQISPFSLLNIPFGWSAHIDGLTTDAIERITHSQFYEYTSADSTVILDSLTAWKRGTTWVEDKTSPTSDHYGQPAFILGSARDNLLKGGAGGDYIEGLAGNDKIKTGHGDDRIDGGEGQDTLVLAGKHDDWTIYHTSKGEIFAHAHDGSGLKLATHIENISFEEQWRSNLNPYEINETGLIDHSYPVLKHLNQNIAYAQHTEGTEQGEVLTGQVVFAQGGDDVILGEVSGSLIHAGTGDDIIRAQAGHNELYGAEGNDILYSGVGSNILFGGIGHDTFAFDTASLSHSEIRDFNQHAGDKDKLVFSHEIFNSTADVLAHSSIESNHVHIQYTGGEVVIFNTTLDQVSQAIQII